MLTLKDRDRSRTRPGSSSASSTNRWMTFPRPNPGADVRLFCFPYAGGTASIFHAWPEAMGKSIEVVGVQLPGRGGRFNETPFTNMQALVYSLRKALAPHLISPFAFFGHSMGASIAFELSKLLAEEGAHLPECLLVSGRPAPQYPSRKPLTFALQQEEFIEELRRLKGTPNEVLANPELLGLLLPAIRADFELIQTYRYHPSPRLGIRISAFGGVEDEDVTEEELRGWSELTSNSFSMQMFPGGHFFLHEHGGGVPQAVARIVRGGNAI